MQNLLLKKMRGGAAGDDVADPRLEIFKSKDLVLTNFTIPVRSDLSFIPNNNILLSEAIFERKSVPTHPAFRWPGPRVFCFGISRVRVRVCV